MAQISLETAAASQARADAAAAAAATDATTKDAAHVAAADPHTGYQKESEKAQASGYASLDGGGTVPDAQIPSSIARDAEVTAADAAHAAAADPHPTYLTQAEGNAIFDPLGSVTTHAAAADPHTGYQRESEKGAASGYAGLDGSGTVPDAQLPATLARDSEVTAAVATHEADTTAIHGIADTANLALKNADNAFSAQQSIAAGLRIKGPSPWIDVTHPFYGAVGDGVADDTAAIQAAITAAKAAHASVFLPSGQYKITDTLTLDNIWGLQIRGAGGPQNQYIASGTYPATVTEFVWAGGTDDRPMFLLKDCRYVVLEDFHITAAIASAGVPKLQCGIETRNAANVAGSLQPMDLRLNRVTMDGTTYGIRRCVRFTNTGGTDTNNDFLIATGCVFSNYLESGVSVEHTQAKALQFYGCHFLGSNDATYAAKAGVACGYTFVHDGVSKGSGTPTYTVSMCSIVWVGGGMHYHSGADFSVGGAGNDGLSVFGLNSEGSARLVYCHGPSTVPTPAHFTRVRHGNSGNLASDGHLVYWRNPGPVTLDGCSIEDAASSVGNLDVCMETSSFTQSASLRLVGNRLDSRGSLPWSSNGIPLMLEVSGNKGIHPDTSAVFDWPNVAPWAGPKVVTNANYTATDGDAGRMIRMTGLTAGRTLTLLTAVGRAGLRIGVMNMTSGQTVTLATTSSQTINGAAASTFNLATQFAFAWFESDGVNWVKVG